MLKSLRGPAFVLLFAVFAGWPAGAQSDAISPRGHWLEQKLDQMEVETKWQAGVHVNWETGLPDGIPERLPGRHTHCSAFVAAAAKRLGSYILRPPEHGQVLLANAQNEWLASDGRDYGWRHVSDGLEAQRLANDGKFVVASYHNHYDNKPGHIAIVRPSAKSLSDIEREGPQLIQAGTVNSASISTKAGFAGHPSAWRDDEIVFYVHAASDRDDGF